MNNKNMIENAADLIVITKNPEETLELGQKLGNILRSGDVVALIGELGAGKTWISKGIAFGLEVPDHEYVNSPAFDLIHEYQGRLPVYHMDFYRLDHLSTEDYLWIEEYLSSPGVCIIEWADKFIDQFTNNFLKVELKELNGEDEREISITNIGEGYKEIVERLKSNDCS